MIRTYPTIKDFFHFVNNFEGELTIKDNVAYHNGNPVAKWQK